MKAQLDAALAALRRGEAVIFPTDTVYGIGLAIRPCAGPDLLYELKGRVRDKAIPWLVADPSALALYGCKVPSYAQSLAEQFWPGALTLIVQAGKGVPAAFRASDNSIALRMPANDIALELITQLGMPLATSSANLAGAKAATSIATLDPALRAAGLVCVDGGSTPGPTPSTIVSCLDLTPKILRVGLIGEREIQSALTGVIS